MGNTANSTLDSSSPSLTKYETVSLSCLAGCITSCCSHCFGAERREAIVTDCDDDIFSEVRRIANLSNQMGVEFVAAA